MRDNEETSRHEDEIDLRSLFNNLKRKWYYSLFSVLLFGAFAFTYVYYALPVYEATSSVIIKDSKNASKNIEDILSGDLYGNTKNIATEIGILSSRSVLEETINELNLRISYYTKSGLLEFPIYKTSPIKVSIARASEEIFDEEFTIEMIDTSKYAIEIDVSNKLLKGFNYKGTHRYGQQIVTPYFQISVLPNHIPFSISKKEKYFFRISSMNSIINSYNERMKVESINKDATIVQITVTDNIPSRATDFLATLCKVYINRDVLDKSSVASLTLKFIDEQLAQISGQLNASELELQKFKEKKGTVDLSEESKHYLERVTSIDEERVKAEINLKALDYLYDYVSKNKDVETLAPSSLGNPDPLLVELITKLKELQSKRRSLMYGSSSESPAVKIIDEQIEQIRKALIENINSIRDLTRASLEALNSKLEEYEGSIRRIPNIEREMLVIQRNFTVNENIYLYLLQKKAETGIAKATAVSDNKVLDEPSYKEVPVSPNKKIIYSMALLLGLILPGVFIVAHGFIKNTIGSREEIESMTKIPIIGTVGHFRSDERLVVASKPKSSIAESFRSIRANLMFFGLSEQHKIVLITSSVGGEGKSFTTLNLATVLSLQNYRVLIVGMDLRKPQLMSDLGVENNEGISTLLIGKTTLEKVIVHTKIQNIDLIPSGPIPPNPAELLSKPETLTLLNTLKEKYDYVLIDTPPVGIVSDAMMLMKHADVNIFLLRENYSKKVFIKYINDYYSKGNINNLCILLNDAGSMRHHEYGYYEKS